MADPERERPQLGLLTTLPIYWNESVGISEVLAEGSEPHWAREVLESAYQLVPLDTLASGDRDAGLASLENLDLLLLAQPRALTGPENVALDAWVRAGGRVLVFADPMLTGHSRFNIGDRRRPQDVVLLSPILRRWGLDLRFDDEQPLGETTAEVAGASLPLNLAGSFQLIPTTPDAPSQCTLLAQGVAARCSIGKGQALVVADAALFEEEEGASDGRRMALSRLAGTAFSDR